MGWLMESVAEGKSIQPPSPAATPMPASAAGQPPKSPAAQPAEPVDVAARSRCCTVDCGRDRCCSIHC